MKGIDEQTALGAKKKIITTIKKKPIRIHDRLACAWFVRISDETLHYDISFDLYTNFDAINHNNIFLLSKRACVCVCVSHFWPQLKGDFFTVKYVKNWIIHLLLYILSCTNGATYIIYMSMYMRAISYKTSTIGTWASYFTYLRLKFHRMQFTFEWL